MDSFGCKRSGPVTRQLSPAALCSSGTTRPFGSTLRRYGFPMPRVVDDDEAPVSSRYRPFFRRKLPAARRRTPRGPDDRASTQAQKLIDATRIAKSERPDRPIFSRHDPANEAANVKLGEVRLAQGLNEDAMKSFEAVLTVRPDSVPARVGEVKAAEAAALADRNAGVDGSALLCLIRARKFVPDSPQLLLDFGIQAERMKIYADADAALTRAHELAPDDAKIIYALAHVEFDEQKTDGRRTQSARLFAGAARRCNRPLWPGPSAARGSAQRRSEDRTRAVHRSAAAPERLLLRTGRDCSRDESTRRSEEEL